MIYLLHAGGLSFAARSHRLLAVVGSILCLLLLAMVGWKSLYALVMLAGCGCFTRAQAGDGKRVGSKRPGRIC